MATTTNYNWSTPDDTSLVKDGAAAIRTLGSSIDTTTKALNPSTTLGDIEYRSSTANTNTRLGIGTTGQVLTVSGGVPTWANAAGGTSLVGCAVYNNGDQTIAGSTWTTALYDSEYWDTDGFHSTSSNTSRITIPTGKGGKYLITVVGIWQSSSSGNRSLSLLKNGADELIRDYQNNNTTTMTQSYVYQASLSAGDYIENRVYQGSGGNLTYYGTSGAAGSLFAVTYLGA